MRESDYSQLCNHSSRIARTVLGVAPEELPEIQEQKNFSGNNAKMNKQLDDIEDRILYLLENCKEIYWMTLKLLRHWTKQKLRQMI